MIIELEDAHWLVYGKVQGVSAFLPCFVAYRACAHKVSLNGVSQPNTKHTYLTCISKGSLNKSSFSCLSTLQISGPNKGYKSVCIWRLMDLKWNYPQAYRYIAMEAYEEKVFQGQYASRDEEKEVKEAYC